MGADLCRCGHNPDAHAGSFTTGQHCNACLAWEPCACCEPPAYTPPPVDALPAALHAARTTLQLARHLQAALDLAAAPDSEMTPQRHIFGAGGCWCGYNQHTYQSGGLNHPQAAAARDFLIAADRMRDRWAEGDNAAKQQLRQDLHTKADRLRDALDLGAAPEEAGGD